MLTDAAQIQEVLAASYNLRLNRPADINRILFSYISHDRLFQGRSYFLSTEEVYARAFMIAVQFQKESQEQPNPFNARELNKIAQRPSSFRLKYPNTYPEQELNNLCYEINTTRSASPAPSPLNTLEHSPLPEDRSNLVFCILSPEDKDSHTRVERVFHTEEFYRPTVPSHFFKIPLVDLPDNKDLLGLIRK